MTGFYCPACWKDFNKDFIRCPFCRLEIPEFRDSKGHVEKLFLALHCPEPTTPVRVAWVPVKTPTPPGSRGPPRSFQNDRRHLHRRSRVCIWSHIDKRAEPVF
jgi:hypothetical protein